MTATARTFLVIDETQSFVGKAQALADKLDYAFDCNAWLDEDGAGTIASHVWSYLPRDGALTLSGAAHASGVVSVYATGGKRGQTYTLTARVTTSDATARIASRSFELTII